MEGNNNANEFTLKQDWNFNKMIFKGDEWVYNQAYDNAYGSMLEYLAIGDEEELTAELIDEAQHLVDYLEKEIGVDQSSPTFYGYYRVVQDWIENNEGASI